MFGRGQREDLDEEEAEGLVGRMRERLVGEVERVREGEGEGAVRRLMEAAGWEEGWEVGKGGSKL